MPATPKNRILVTKVAGVTFECRQDHIVKLRGDEPIRIIPEPENPYDSNALGVWTVIEGQRVHVGYVPRYTAEVVAPYLEGEQCMAKLREITGGFGEDPIYGLLIQIEIPSETVVKDAD